MKWTEETLKLSKLQYDNRFGYLENKALLSMGIDKSIALADLGMICSVLSNIDNCFENKFMALTAMDTELIEIAMIVMDMYWYNDGAIATIRPMTYPLYTLQNVTPSTSNASYEAGMVPTRVMPKINLELIESCDVVLRGIASEKVTKETLSAIFSLCQYFNADNTEVAFSEALVDRATMLSSIATRSA